MADVRKACSHMMADTEREWRRITPDDMRTYNRRKGKILLSRQKTQICTIISGSSNQPYRPSVGRDIQAYFMRTYEMIFDRMVHNKTLDTVILHVSNSAAVGIEHFRSALAPTGLQPRWVHQIMEAL